MSCISDHRLDCTTAPLAGCCRFDRWWRPASAVLRVLVIALMTILSALGQNNILEKQGDSEYSTSVSENSILSHSTIPLSVQFSIFRDVTGERWNVVAAGALRNIAMEKPGGIRITAISRLNARYDG